MESITLEPIGEIKVKRPRSFAAVYDLVLSTHGLNTGQRTRLAAAAIGICWSDENETKRPPDYPLAQGDPLAYGGVMLHWLTVRKVAFTDLNENGHRLINWAWEGLPKTNHLEEAEDFSVVSAEG